MKRIGIYNPYLSSRGGGEKVTLALASVLAERKNTEVTLIAHEDINLKLLGEYFNVDVSNLKLDPVNYSRLLIRLLFRLPLPGGIKSLLIDTYTFRSIKNRDYDLFINNAYQSNMPSVGKKGVYVCMFPQTISPSDENGVIKNLYRLCLRKVGKIIMHPKHIHGVYTYNTIIANSEFTKEHIKKYWNLNSEVIYPICENMEDKSVKKEKVILNVGRFFGFDKSSHHKRQDVLLDVFKNMPELYKNGWELHFAGSAANDKKAKHFVKEIQKNSEGFPVYFHFDVNHNDLKTLYNKATIYWHATGYGANQTNPERMEHFGITTVEAMSAGAVPVTLRAAGQKESVMHGKNGYLWNSKSELENLTKKLIENPKHYNLIANQAKKRSRTFSKDSFERSVTDLFDYI